MLSSSGDESTGSKWFASNMEKSALAYYNCNRFLSTFIDHGLKDLDYTVQEKTVVQRLLDVEEMVDCSEG